MSANGSTAIGPAQGLRLLLPLPAACAAVLGVLVYWNALHGPFVYDDFRLIVENPSLNLRDVEAVLVRDITRPIVNVSYAIDTWLWGRAPFGYHVTNLLLHVFNVVLVYWVAVLAWQDRRRRESMDAAAPASAGAIGFATAALFAVHPMLTEAVSYVAGRSEVLYSAFFLLAFLAGRRWMVNGGRVWWVVCVGSWVGGMLTKESAAMLPLVLVAYDWLVLDGDRVARRRRFIGLELPMLVATVLGGISRIAVLMLVEYAGRPGLEWRFALVSIDVFWRYLALLFAPVGQSIFHAVPRIETVMSPRVIGGLVGLAGYVGVVWALRRHHALVSFGLIWFAMLLVPAGLLTTLGRGEAMAEHRVYLSSAGLFLTWGYAFANVWTPTSARRVLAAGGALVFLASLGFLTIMRNVVWQDPVALTLEAAELAPGHWMPRVLAGEAYRQSGQCSEAVGHYRTAITIRPREEFPYTMLAACLVQGRRLQEAQETLRQLRRLNPGSQEASMGLGVFALLDGRLREARAYLQETVDRDPSYARAQRLLTFLDGTLPAEEQQRVCEEMGMLSGHALAVHQCKVNSPAVLQNAP